MAQEKSCAMALLLAPAAVWQASHMHYRRTASCCTEIGPDGASLMGFNCDTGKPDLMIEVFLPT